MKRRKKGAKAGLPRRRSGNSLPASQHPKPGAKGPSRLIGGPAEQPRRPPTLAGKGVPAPLGQAREAPPAAPDPALPIWAGGAASTSGRNRRRPRCRLRKGSNGPPGPGPGLLGGGARSQPPS